VKNLKLLFSLTLSLLVLFQTLSVSITYAYYNLDTKGFIETFCENKDKPELACNGKCHLKKVTQSTNNKENTPIQLTEIKELLLYNEQPFSYQLKNAKNLKKQHSHYVNLYTYHRINNCFHPPKKLI
jgi:hypothetical protein